MASIALWVTAVATAVLALPILVEGVAALSGRLPKILDSYRDRRERRHQYGAYSRSPWMRD